MGIKSTIKSNGWRIGWMKPLSEEKVAEARRLVEEKGMTIRGAAKELGIARGSLQWRAIRERWRNVKPPGRPKEVEFWPEAERMAVLEEAIKREEAIMAAEGLVVRAEELEVVARKALVRDSARVRMELSRKVVETLLRVDEAMKPKEAAQTLLALKTVAAGIYPWEREPSLEEMKYADSPLANAIDIKFLAMTPAQLREEAEEKMALAGRSKALRVAGLRRHAPQHRNELWRRPEYR
jgi:hypothetical protein